VSPVTPDVHSWGTPGRRHYTDVRYPCQTRACRSSFGRLLYTPLSRFDQS